MKPTQEQLDRINGRLPGCKVSEDMVEVLPFMMFDSDVTDRFTYMSPEMMAKLVLDLDEGRVAFNALHQSHSTLPVGASIAGRMRKSEGVKQVQAVMYAVVKNPDGSTAVDGKTIADKYNTGAARACSAGVQVGLYECSVCGNDIRDYRNCEHIPGRSYQKDEKPIVCIAKMTGRNIVNGVAMDCGAYELSAVTAGGVANAGILTQAFGKYDGGSEVSVADFKKEIEESLKSGNTRVTFVAAPEAPTTPHKESTIMETNQNETSLQDRYDALVRQEAQTAAEFKLLKTQFETQVASAEVAAGKLAAAEASATASAAEFKIKETEQVAALTELQSKYDALAAERDQLVAAEAGVPALTEQLGKFKGKLVDIVQETGNRLGKTADYAAMELEALVEAYNGHLGELAKLPSGRLTADEAGDEATVEGQYHGVPAACFATAK